MKGFELIIADANYWFKSTLDRWRNYWSYRLNVEDVRTIPAWAKHPIE
ncbi:MAG: hypothetical protein PHE48_03015 [Candidatus Daviesbacteria bacterium]|nr:hypothetical protein [Candidatus Daviesbacteria bacterium]